MKKLTYDQMVQMEGADMECAQTIIIGASIGSFFGGVGAVIGAVAGAGGEDCLGWW